MIEFSTAASADVAALSLVYKGGFKTAAEKFPRVKIAHQLLGQVLVQLGGFDVFSDKLDPEQSKAIAKVIEIHGLVPNL